MTLSFTESDLDELCQQTAATRPPAQRPDDFETDDFEIVEVELKGLGHGYERSLQLLPGLWLSFYEQVSQQDWRLEVEAHDHLIQMGVWLSGCIDFDAVHPTLGGTCGYFSGSGVSPAYIEKHRGGQYLAAVNIELQPQLLASFLADGQYCSEIQKQLFKGQDWKVSFYPTVTPAMRSLAHQMWHAPYHGTVKRMYLQAKVFELLAMHLDAIALESKQTHPHLKPETIGCLHHARDILTRQFENPPSLSALAQQVGVSERTLQRGFRELFDTTAFQYLQTLRMERAEQLLRSREMRVSDVAHAVGYIHLGHFTQAFKRRFGITPKQCQMGQVNARPQV